jgi:hypothetical protein
MKNIHILPTDKPSRIAYYGKELKYSKTKPVQLFLATLDWKLQNIYITSDEEIKIGDREIIDNECRKLKFTKDETRIGKKIILTTDQDLIKDGVQAIDDEFLEWFVKNPSCEFVEIQCRYNFYAGQDLTHYKIIIPQEEPKQETLEEAAEHEWIYNEYGFETGYNPERCINGAIQKPKFINGFIKGAKWQAERMYSEEEVKQLVKDITNEIEIRKQNIISKSETMTTHLLEGGCIAFESSQDVVKKLFEQFRHK